MSATPSILGALGGGVLVGALSAGLDAAGGAIGAAIFKAAGYSDYDATEAAQMGAIGGAILGGSLGTVAGAIAGCTDNFELQLGGVAGCAGLIWTSTSSVLSGLIGYSVMNQYEATKTIMNLGETALSFLVGGAIASVAAAPAIACVVLVPIAAMMVVSNCDKTPQLKEGPDLENPQEPKGTMHPR